MHWHCDQCPEEGTGQVGSDGILGVPWLAILEMTFWAYVASQEFLPGTKIYLYCTPQWPSLGFSSVLHTTVA